MSSGFNSGAIDPALLISGHQHHHQNNNNNSNNNNSNNNNSNNNNSNNSNINSSNINNSQSQLPQNTSHPTLGLSSSHPSSTTLTPPLPHLPSTTTITPSSSSLSADPHLSLIPRSSDPTTQADHHHPSHRSQPSSSATSGLVPSSVFPLGSSTLDQPPASSSTPTSSTLLPPTHPAPNSTSAGGPSSSHPLLPPSASFNLPPSQSTIPPTIPSTSTSDPTLLNGSAPTQSSLPNLRDRTSSSSQEHEMHQKDQELAQFLLRMEDYKPVIPDRVAAYYLSKVGFESTDIRVQRLLVLACQKFISDIAQDAFSYARTRTGQAPGSRQGPLAPLSNSAGLSTGLPNHPGTRKDRTRTVLTQEDLAQALAEYGINASRAPYYL